MNADALWAVKDLNPGKYRAILMAQNIPTDVTLEDLRLKLAVLAPRNAPAPRPTSRRQTSFTVPDSVVDDEEVEVEVQVDWTERVSLSGTRCASDSFTASIPIHTIRAGRGAVSDYIHDLAHERLSDLEWSDTDIDWDTEEGNGPDLDDVNFDSSDIQDQLDEMEESDANSD